MGYPSRAGHQKRKSKEQGEGFFSMLCFQMGFCFLTLIAFFSAIQMGGENAEAAKESAALFCGQEADEWIFDIQMIPLPNEKWKEWWLSMKSFWSGGATEVLEKLRDFLSEQVVPPEELPPEDIPVVVGESGAGGELPPSDMRLAAQGTTLAPYHLTAQMVSPVSGLVTSSFGWRGHPITQKADFHKGVDIAAAMDTPILAALPGVVEETGYSESYGNFVVLRHSENLRTTYNHCSEILAKEGEYLARGDRIALVGSTGISTGPHLHFEVEVKGLKADPLFSLEVKEYAAE